MSNFSLYSCFIKDTKRVVNREVSYVHGPNASLSEHTLKTHFDYDKETNILTLKRDMSRFDITPKEVPDSFMDHKFCFVDNNGRVIESNYYTIRHILSNYSSVSKKQKGRSSSFKKKVFSSYIIPGSSFGFSF